MKNNNNNNIIPQLKHQNCNNGNDNNKTKKCSPYHEKCFYIPNADIDN